MYRRAAGEGGGDFVGRHCRTVGLNGCPWSLPDGVECVALGAMALTLFKGALAGARARKYRSCSLTSRKNVVCDFVFSFFFLKHLHNVAPSSVVNLTFCSGLSLHQFKVMIFMLGCHIMHIFALVHLPHSHNIAATREAREVIKD